MTKRAHTKLSLLAGLLPGLFIAAGCQKPEDEFVAALPERDSVMVHLPALVITKEAGATLTDGTGKPLRGTSSSQTIMVATPALAKTLVKQVGE